MKRYILILFFGFLSFNLYAQRFYGGVLGGFNGSQVDGDHTGGFHKLGASVGVWTATDINENFYWSMELKYNEKGSRIQPTKKNDYRKYIYRLNYIDLPVTLGYKYDDNLKFFAGASAGYLVHKYGEDNMGQDPNDFFATIDAFDFDIVLGMKVDFSLFIDQPWAHRTQLDFRWQHSIVPFVDYGSAQRYRDTGQFNNFLSTTLFYQIEL